ncbi:MAG: hypothetical protein ACYSYV_10860 [Planctomycetota bacterium]|jgi:hypothetical protein
MKPADNVEEAIKKELNFTASAELHDRMLDDVLNAQEKSKKKKSALALPSIGRTIMKSPITKFAAAAVIVVVVLVGIDQSDISNVAWGDVAGRVDQALTYTCRVHLRDRTREKEPMDIEAVIYGSTEYGQKQDVGMNGKFLKHTYFLPAEKVEIDVMPVEKTYRRKPLTDKDIEQRGGGDMRETLKKCTAYKHKKLGRDKIDGIDVEGIEVYDPNLCTASFTVDSLTAQLWVDIETNLPVLLKAEIKGTKGEKAILEAEKFQWNVELDPSIFEPNIPDDYTAVE